MREENIRLGTLPSQATDHHLYHTDAEVVNWNRKRVGLHPVYDIKETTAYEADDERALPQRRYQRWRRKVALNLDAMSVRNGGELRSPMAERFPPGPNIKYWITPGHIGTPRDHRSRQVPPLRPTVTVDRTPPPQGTAVPRTDSPNINSWRFPLKQQDPVGPTSSVLAKETATSPVGKRDSEQQK